MYLDRNTENFKLGEEVWIVKTKAKIRVLKCYPLLYGTAIEDYGFSVMVKTKNDGNMEICRANCFHTKKECQIACDKFNKRREN